MTNRKHSTASINLALNRNVYTGKTNAEKKVKATIHDSVAIGGRNVGVGGDVEEITMLYLGPKWVEILPPVMAKLGIHVTENDLKTQGLKYI